MAYTVAEFKAEIDKHGGYESLLALYFNNSNVKTFNVGEVFDDAINLDEPTETLIFHSKDIQGRGIVITRKLMYLEGMAFAADVKERDRIDLRQIRY